MRLLSIPIRMAMRYGRWVARGAGVTMAGLMFAAVNRHEILHFPWMTHSYEIGIADPYIAAVTAYWVTVRILVAVMARFCGAARAHLDRLNQR